MTLETNGSESGRHSPTIGLIVFTVQASLSLIANSLVVALFISRRRLLCNPHNRCIMSLSITDILASISILFAPRLVIGEEFYKSAAHEYMAREFFCRILWNNFLCFALSVTSVYTSIVLSVERWLAVRRSMFYKMRFKVRHMNMLIIAAWVVGFMTELPVVIFAKGVYENPEDICGYVFPQDKTLSICLSTGLFLFQTVIPLTIITLAYIDIFRGIKTALQFATSARAENVSGIKRLKKVTKVAATTTFVLAVCWLPCSVWFYISLLYFEPPNHYYSPSRILVATLVFTNGCINPCIYVFSNPELRKALRNMFR